VARSLGCLALALNPYVTNPYISFLNTVGQYRLGIISSLGGTETSFLVQNPGPVGY